MKNATKTWRKKASKNKENHLSSFLNLKIIHPVHKYNIRSIGEKLDNRIFIVGLSTL